MASRTLAAEIRDATADNGMCEVTRDVTSPGTKLSSEVTPSCPSSLANQRNSSSSCMPARLREALFRGVR